MPIHLHLKDYLAMVRHARDMAPVEDCGLIGGRIDGEDKIIEKVFYLTNVDHSEEHFSLDPKEQFDAVRALREQGLELLGNWHSHPASPSRPTMTSAISARRTEDKRLAFDTKASYLILSLHGGEPVLNSFQISRDKTVTKEDLRIR